MVKRQDQEVGRRGRPCQHTGSQWSWGFPTWLHLWPIKQLGPMGGEARKRGALASAEQAPLILAGKNCHSGGLLSHLGVPRIGGG